MVDVQPFFDQLIQSGISFFCCVPDSLLKDFCAYVTDHTKPKVFEETLSAQQFHRLKIKIVL